MHKLVKKFDIFGAPNPTFRLRNEVRTYTGVMATAFILLLIFVFSLLKL